MNRTIKFRGKVSSGEWMIGDLNQIGGKFYIFPRQQDVPLNSPDWFEVDPDTVGMLTGFKAKKFKKDLSPEIYEGDVFREESKLDSGDFRKYLVVTWIQQRGAFYMIDVAHHDVVINNDVSEEPEFSWLFDDAQLNDFSLDVGLSKVGIIHDMKYSEFR